MRGETRGSVLNVDEKSGIHEYKRIVHTAHLHIIYAAHILQSVPYHAVLIVPKTGLYIYASSTKLRRY